MNCWKPRRSNSAACLSWRYQSPITSRITSITRFVAIGVERIFDFVLLRSTNRNAQRCSLEFHSVPRVRSHRIGAAPEKIFYSNGGGPRKTRRTNVSSLCHAAMSASVWHRKFRGDKPGNNGDNQWNV
jgi:hypothetical protein